MAKPIEAMKKIAEFITSPEIIINLSVILLLSGAFIFMMGFHNMDLSTDMLRVAYRYRLDYTDMKAKTLGGSVITFDQAYIFGLRQQFISLFFLLTGAFLLGKGLTKLQIRRR